MIHKLLSANEAMETQVRQRTQQLEEANQGWIARPAATR